MNSNAQPNIEVVKAWLEAHNRDDIEAELAFWADDAHMTIVPTGKTYNGKDELRAAAQMAVKSHGRKTLVHIFADDEWVCAEYTSTSTVHGPMDAHNISIPAGVTKEIKLEICFLANIQNGKIVRSREYWDSASMMKQLAG